jgi:hypothetical protein
MNERLPDMTVDLKQDVVIDVSVSVSILHNATIISSSSIVYNWYFKEYNVYI